MIKLQAAQRLMATHWWDALDAEQKKEYIKEHPDSKYAKESTKDSVEPKEPEDDDSFFEDDEPKKPEKKPESKDPKKPGTKPDPKKPGTKPDPEHDESLTRHLVKKGEKKGKDVFKEGGHEILRRLIDPMSLTDVGKKGELPELPSIFKSRKGKAEDLRKKLTKLRKQQKGFGKNVPEHLKKQVRDLSSKLEELEED